MIFCSSQSCKHIPEFTHTIISIIISVDEIIYLAMCLFLLFIENESYLLFGFPYEEIGAEISEKKDLIT